MSAADKERSANREREKGNEAYKAGDFKEAYDYYTKSINFFPTAAAYNNRAIAAIKLSKFSEAVSDCSIALQQEPTNTKALLRRATAYRSLKNYNSAIADLQTVLRLEPTNATAKSDLEAVQKESASQQGGRGTRVPVQEVNDSTGTSKSSSSSSGVPRDAGQGRTSMGQGSGPSQTVPPGPAPVNPLLEEPPPPPLPPKVQKLKDEGNVFFKAGQYVDAEVKYTAALNELEKAGKEHEPSIALLLSNRAACLLKNGNSPKCIEDCTRSLTLTPLNVKTILRRAAAYDSLEKYGYAFNDYQLALKLDSSIELAATAAARLGRLLSNQYGGDWKSKLPDHPETDRAMNLLSARRAQFAGSQGENVPQMGTAGVQQAAGGAKTSAPAPSQASPAGVKPDAQSSVFGAQQPAAKVDTTMPKQGGQTTPIFSQPPPVATPAPKVSSVPLPAKVEKLKEEGNTLFKKGQYADAENKYTQALKELGASKDHNENRALLLSNRAACYLKDSCLTKCVEDCTQSLILSPLNLKTILRRAQAYENMEKYAQAYNDYQLSLKVDSTVDQAIIASDRLARHLKDKHGDGWKTKLPPNPEADIVLAALRNTSSGTSQQPSNETLYDRSREAGNTHTKKV